MTKLDVLDSFPEIKICIAYRIDRMTVEELPHTALLERAEPMYETWPGWQRPTRDVRRWDDLPSKAQAYVARIAELAGAPIRYVSVGAEREAMIEV